MGNAENPTDAEENLSWEKEVTLANYLKLIPQEIVLHLVKKVPGVGDSVEIVRSIASNVKQDAIATTVTEHDRQLSTLDQEVHRQSVELSQTQLGVGILMSKFHTLCKELLNQRMDEPHSSGFADAPSIGNIQALPYEGAFVESKQWNTIKEHPEQAGARWLFLGDKPNPQMMHVLVDDQGEARILELPPLTFQQLLDDQSNSKTEVDIKRGPQDDIWIIRNPVQEDTAPILSASSEQLPSDNHSEEGQPKTPYVVSRRTMLIWLGSAIGLGGAAVGGKVAYESFRTKTIVEQCLDLARQIKDKNKVLVTNNEGFGGSGFGEYVIYLNDYRDNAEIARQT